MFGFGKHSTLPNWVRADISHITTQTVVTVKRTRCSFMPHFWSWQNCLNLPPSDEVVVIWDPSLVKDFKNKSLTECAKDVISEVFLSLDDVENAAQFCHQIYALLLRAAHEAFQEMSMASVAESNVGIYSMCHDDCVTVFGYEHPKSIRLAYMYINTILSPSRAL